MIFEVAGASIVLFDIISSYGIAIDLHVGRLTSPLACRHVAAAVVRGRATERKASVWDTQQKYTDPYMICIKLLHSINLQVAPRGMDRTRERYKTLRARSFNLCI